MKKSLIALSTIALMAGTAAKAADIIVYQEEAAAPTQINWTGFYTGGTIGGAWAESKTRLRGEVPTADADKNGWGRLAKKTVNPDAFIGGIYAGYNFQIGALSNTFLKDVVFGVETDFLFNSGDDKGSDKINSDLAKTSFGVADGYNTKYTARVKQKWNGATRFRAGYALGSEGRFLPYLATGVSYTDIQAKGKIIAYKEGEDNILVGRHSQTKSRAGWNIGGGIDYIPPIMNDHLVLRAEYRFTNYGRDDYSVKDINGVKKYNQTVKYHSNDFRVGVAYKF